MRKLHYHLVDVFTDRAFGGNPLAVFPDGQGITDQTMQALAKELNLSETTFVLPPEDDQNTYRVRIFTSAMELPMAGHPTVGTAFMLARLGLIPWENKPLTIRFEEGIGIIPVALTPVGHGDIFAQMRQPQPTFGAQLADRKPAAEMLSLNENELDEQLPIEVVSCGNPFLLVPVRNLAAMRKMKLRLDIGERVLAETQAMGIMPFTLETELEGSSVHSRVFAPNAGVIEDPATGSAAGPLGSYMVRHGLLTSTPKAKLLGEQGFEMGRPSLIHIEIDQEAGEITGVYVGGQSVYMGEGDFYID